MRYLPFDTAFSAALVSAALDLVPNTKRSDRGRFFFQVVASEPLTYADLRKRVGFGTDPSFRAAKVSEDENGIVYELSSELCTWVRL